jgi:hypothetical protein
MKFLKAFKVLQDKRWKKNSVRCRKYFVELSTYVLRRQRAAVSTPGTSVSSTETSAETSLISLKKSSAKKVRRSLFMYGGG